MWPVGSGCYQRRGEDSLLMPENRVKGQKRRSKVICGAICLEFARGCLTGTDKMIHTRTSDCIEDALKVCRCIDDPSVSTPRQRSKEERLDNVDKVLELACLGVMHDLRTGKVPHPPPLRPCPGRACLSPSTHLRRSKNASAGSSEFQGRSCLRPLNADRGPNCSQLR